MFYLQEPRTHQQGVHLPWWRGGPTERQALEEYKGRRTAAEASGQIGKGAGKGAKGDAGLGKGKEGPGRGKGKGGQHRHIGHIMLYVVMSNRSIIAFNMTRNRIKRL